MTDLKAPFGPLAFFLDLEPDLGDFRADVIAGLSRVQKTVSPKYFYDERGSKIFDKITKLKDYYPTLTEKELFLGNAGDIAGSIQKGAAIFEYGSGSSDKVEWLVRSVENTSAYVAMDISRDHLLESAKILADVLPVPVAAVCADFHAPVHLPKDHLPKTSGWLGYFPGSTIGNMTPEAATSFLQQASKTLGENAQFLVGFDLEKDIGVLERAYDDSEGVTAEFNLNLLQRMKKELGADLTVDDFEHYAFYNQTDCRIEMHLRAIRDTAITIDGQTFTLSTGETIHTENSHKYSVARFAKLLENTPWTLEKSWTDPRNWYAACLLSNR